MTYTRIKICGITRAEDALLVANLGADAIGLVFYQQSPRYVSIEQAKQIIAELPAFVTTVGLFVNTDNQTIQKTLDHISLDLLQFQGQESADFCQQFNKPYIKAVHMKMAVDLPHAIETYGKARAILLDTYNAQQPGGTGVVFDWRLIPQNLAKPIILAGGLNPDNVIEAVRQVNPYGVDVSSGVELSPGVKDPIKLKKFIAEVRSADYEKD